MTPPKTLFGTIAMGKSSVIPLKRGLATTQAGISNRDRKNLEYF
jgi:hypothetical protein